MNLPPVKSINGARTLVRRMVAWRRGLEISQNSSAVPACRRDESRVPGQFGVGALHKYVAGRQRLVAGASKPFFKHALMNSARFTVRWLGLLALAAVGLLTCPARAQVTQNLGTLADGESVTITFEVTINSPLPAGVTQISAQGTVSGDNFATVSTDDPETALLNDPTVTALAQNFDFGDAPTAAQSGFASSYPTLLADNGARHFLPAGGATLYIGSTAP